MWIRIAVTLAIAASAVFGQPGQLAPMQPSRNSRDASVKPALPPGLAGIGIDQRLDQQVPLDLIFRDEAGRPLPLSTYFNGNKPVILALVYHQCPMLCNLIMNGVESSLRTMSLNPGRDFEVLSVSFDPKDTPEIAAAKKLTYLKRYRRPNTANGWHFLTGEEASIQALTSAVGYRYRYDAATGQFAHASGIMVLTPQGRISKYFYGVEYAPRDLRLGLVEASKNKIGTAVDQLLLFCYHYDPATGKYGAIAMNFVRLTGGAFVLVGGAFLLLVWRRDRKDSRRAG